MKFFVGLVGVGLVLLAVVASIGILSYMGVAGSLIILEVVPFLVLAVGVDNLFIIVHSYEVSMHAHLFGPPALDRGFMCLFYGFECILWVKFRLP